MSFRGLQILSHRGYNLVRINSFSQRAFHHGHDGWRHRWHHWHKTGRKWGNRMRHNAEKMEHGQYGKHFGRWHGYRYHGHWHHHPHVVYKYGKSSIGYAGMTLAMIISYNQYESIMWAVIHGFFNWFYVGYYVYRNSEISTRDSLHAQVDELSAEIDKLAAVYNRVQVAVKDINNSIKQKETMQTLDSSTSKSVETDGLIFNEDDAKSGAKA